MAVPGADRVRASKLRKRLADGAALSVSDAAFLDKYSTRATIAKAKAAAPPPATAVRGPQLALHGGDAPPNPRAVHETPREVEALDASSLTWVPTMPEGGEGDPVPTPGATPPPAAGTPLVDPAPSSGPAGDPAAAAQFAALISFLTGLGLTAGRELAADLDLPPDVRALLASAELSTTALETVHAAAERVALKYGFRSVPLGDEAVVAAALAGSAAAVFTNMKRKRLAAAKAPAAGPSSPSSAREPAAAPPSDLDKLWDGDA